MAPEICKHHSGHDAEIKANRKSIDEHNDDSNKVRAALFKAIDALREEIKELRIAWASRLPIWATFLIGGLMSTCSALAVYVITHK